MTQNKKETFEEKCIDCGCTENKACNGGCSWIPLCSSCYDIQKYDSITEALSAQKKEWREKIGKYKFPEIKHEGELLSIEFPKAKNAHESNELFLQFGWNQALQEVLEILE